MSAPTREEMDKAVDVAIGAVLLAEMRGTHGAEQEAVFARAAVASALDALYARLATLEAERDAARGDVDTVAALRALYDSVDFEYGDPPRAVVAFGLPGGARVSADPQDYFDAAIAAARVTTSTET